MVFQQLGEQPNQETHDQDQKYNASQREVAALTCVSSGIPVIAPPRSGGRLRLATRNSDAVVHHVEQRGDLERHPRIFGGVVLGTRSPIDAHNFGRTIEVAPLAQSMIEVLKPPHCAEALVTGERLHAGPLELGSQEFFVERCVVGDDRTIADKVTKLLGNFNEGALIRHVPIGYAMYAG